MTYNAKQSSYQGLLQDLGTRNMYVHLSLSKYFLGIYFMEKT